MVAYFEPKKYTLNQDFFLTFMLINSLVWTLPSKESIFFKVFLSMKIWKIG